MAQTDSSTKKAIGIYSVGETASLVLVERAESGSLMIIETCTLPLSVIADKIKSNPDAEIVSVLPGHHVTSKQISTPTKAKEWLLRVLEFEGGSDEDGQSELMWGYHLCDRGDTGVSIINALVSDRKALGIHLERLKKFGVTPTHVTTSQEALFDFSVDGMMIYREGDHHVVVIPVEEGYFSTAIHLGNQTPQLSRALAKVVGKYRSEVNPDATNTHQLYHMGLDDELVRMLMENDVFVGETKIEYCGVGDRVEYNIALGAAFLGLDYEGVDLLKPPQSGKRLLKRECFLGEPSY